MRTLALVLALTLLAGGFLLWSTSGRLARVDGRAVSGEGEARTEKETPLVPAHGAGAERQQAAEVEAPEAATAPAEDAAAAPSAKGLVVRGTVRFSSDHRPAAGARFALHHPEGYVLVETDDEGRFATAPEVVPGVLRPWHLAEPGDERLALHLRFAPESFPADAATADAEVELFLLDPEQLLEVEVVTRDGRSAAGVGVRFEEWSEKPGEPGLHRATTNETDAKGRVAFPLYELAELSRAELVALDAERDLVSDRVVLVTPISSALVHLVLDVPGRILVRVRDGAGDPVPGQRLWISASSKLAAWIGGSTDSDAAGEARIAPLPPGPYDLGLVSAPEARATVEVLRGVEHEVELTLPQGFVTLAAAGRVLDEEGAPLEGVEIEAVLAPDRSERTTTDSTGRFEFRAAPVPTVRLVADADPFGDVYEPSTQEVLFGTPDAVFRRTETLPRATLSLEVVDAATGERVQRVLVLGYRLPHLGSYSFHRASDGLVQLRLTLHHGTRLAVDAPGYRRRHLDPGPLLDASTESTVHRIALEPGLARTVRVVNAADLKPCPGARVLLRGTLLGVADADGLVDLDLHEQVGELVFEAEGRTPEVVDPAGWLSDLEAPLILLDSP